MAKAGEQARNDGENGHRPGAYSNAEAQRCRHPPRGGDEGFTGLMKQHRYTISTLASESRLSLQSAIDGDCANLQVAGNGPRARGKGVHLSLMMTTVDSAAAEVPLPEAST